MVVGGYSILYLASGPAASSDTLIALFPPLNIGVLLVAPDSVESDLSHLLHDFILRFVPVKTTKALDIVNFQEHIDFSGSYRNLDYPRGESLRALFDYAEVSLSPNGGLTFNHSVKLNNISRFEFVDLNSSRNFRFTSTDSKTYLAVDPDVGCTLTSYVLAEYSIREFLLEILLCLIVLGRARELDFGLIFSTAVCYGLLLLVAFASLVVPYSTTLILEITRGLCHILLVVCALSWFWRKFTILESLVVASCTLISMISFSFFP